MYRAKNVCVMLPQAPIAAIEFPVADLIPGSRIQEQHQPSDFNLQDASMRITNLDTDDMVRMFQVRATAELKRELDEVKWWEDRVRRGLVRREHVEGYIQASKRIIRTKRHVLGVPEFPC
jgi:hypothetical protein